MEGLACEATPIDDHPSAGNAAVTVLPDLSATWPRLFEHLTARYGWTPEEIAALTLAQAELLLGATRDRPRLALLSRGAFRRLCDAVANKKPAPTAMREPSPSRSDDDRDRFQRLAWVRHRLPEVFAPLSASALGRLATAVARLDRRQASHHRSFGRMRRTNIVGGRFDGERDGGQLSGVVRKLDVLLETLRRDTVENRVSIPFDPVVPTRFQ